MCRPAAYQVGGESGQVRAPLRRAAMPAHEHVDERVLHVDQHADGHVDARDALDDEHRGDERRPRPAVLLADLDAEELRRGNNSNNNNPRNGSF